MRRLASILLLEGGLVLTGCATVACPVHRCSSCTCTRATHSPAGTTWGVGIRLWLVALRCQREIVGTWQCLWLGFMVMPPGLLLALGALVCLG